MIVFLLAALTVARCAGGSIIPESPLPQTRDALLILPGLGYGRAGRASMRKFQTFAAERGVDVYVADILEGAGLDESRAALKDFIEEHRLTVYRRLYVFAFIAGGYILNPLLEETELPNLAGIVYDRSPTQERAPYVATERLGWIVRLGIGQLIFDIAEREYPGLKGEEAPVGMLIETRRTRIIRAFPETALARGPYRYEPEAFGLPHLDFCYIPYNHSEVYAHFHKIGPIALEFFRTNRFPDDCQRAPPAQEPPPPK